MTVQLNVGEEDSCSCYGVACDTVWIDGQAVGRGRMVEVPPGARLALAEGFCPADLVPLGGDTRRWCPVCKVTWRIRQEQAA